MHIFRGSGCYVGLKGKLLRIILTCLEDQACTAVEIRHLTEKLKLHDGFKKSNNKYSRDHSVWCYRLSIHKDAAVHW